ncbi:phosphatidylglycerophosphatase A [Roseococcus sp. SYP-B2431]|uniref:phosphatidylglycerophosphatase A family protein n=1 Tax=Roseococcus sp. SYP-B2431 TaxID=2496640 RepID=UPI00103B82FC|nr:phosphatidylglycerophosphatase A [Roseococcus sp. SYP-B2431]TCH96435.1 phosphatidylglycerophosphatase A [Roseococcus sp. SYP-B2431]
MGPLRAVASLGGIGFLRPAPGTWGSAAVLPIALLPAWAALVAALVFTLAGYWAVARLPEAAADPGWVVVDEAAGQSLALAAASGWIGVALAFALFRAFDILKPGPVGWADRRKGAFGVMADDVIAGAMAAAILLILAALGLA